MQPDLEIVQVRADQSFKAWSHGYPFRTVRWHFHPEYELHLVSATEGTRYVGDHIGHFRVGDLVFVGPNLPHNWISDIPEGQSVDERCLVIMFTEEMITNCLATFPEMRFVEKLLHESRRGIKFDEALGKRIEPLMRLIIEAKGSRRIALFIEILDLICHDTSGVPLSSAGFMPDTAAYMSDAMNLVLRHIGTHFTADLNEAELAKLSGQSVSAFSRSFRKHTGMTFVQYVNALRIELACQHLTREEATITEICFEVGFNNVSNFNRQFLNAKLMSPSKFRSRYRTGTRISFAA